MGTYTRCPAASANAIWHISLLKNTSFFRSGLPPDFEREVMLTALSIVSPQFRWLLPDNQEVLPVPG